MKAEDGKITLDYHVEDVTNGTQTVEVEYMGAKTIAPIPAREVTLVNGDVPYGHGTITLRFVGPQIGPALSSIFVPGSGVKITVEASSDPSAPTIAPVTENPIPEGEPVPEEVVAV